MRKRERAREPERGEEGEEGAGFRDGEPFMGLMVEMIEAWCELMGPLPVCSLLL